MNPNQRIDVHAALAHPYFTLYYDPHDEPEAENPFNHEMEVDDQLNLDELKDMVFREIQDFINRPHE